MPWWMEEDRPDYGVAKAASFLLRFCFFIDGGKRRDVNGVLKEEGRKEKVNINFFSFGARLGAREEFLCAFGLKLQFFFFFSLGKVGGLS